ncbi:hypothetical protein PoB_004761200 [Plakobranchus ocellatus]|uniref:Uncharacterized protein n=1 Tax=Plakobranchus ocellatus TaxID=259542 RepID=A0AAV4BQ64_9GAST|nr:hypothetical protein PoB_004761200 [Plakobranchus ocellatus]
MDCTPSSPLPSIEWSVSRRGLASSGRKSWSQQVRASIQGSGGSSGWAVGCQVRGPWFESQSESSQFSLLPRVSPALKMAVNITTGHLWPLLTTLTTTDHHGPLSDIEKENNYTSIILLVRNANPNPKLNPNPNLNLHAHLNPNPNADPNIYPQAKPNPISNPNPNPKDNPNTYDDSYPKITLTLSQILTLILTLTLTLTLISIPKLNPPPDTNSNAKPYSNPNPEPNHNRNTNPNIYPHHDPNHNSNANPNA